MIVVRIEHKIQNYEGWKKAFDSDPINRKKSGVKRYRIFRPSDDLNYVAIDLEFDNLSEAQATYQALQNMMPKVEGTIVIGPTIRILNLAESQELE